MGRTARGRPIINLVPVGKAEKIAAVVSVREISDEDERDLLFVSRHGLVKRTALSAYKNIRMGGLIACGVADDDEVAVVKLMDPDDEVDVMILTHAGQSIRFRKGGPKGAPVFGRTARGNKGVKLRGDDLVVDALLVPAADVGSEDDDDGETEDTSIDTVDETLDDDGVQDYGPLLLTVTTNGYGKRTPVSGYKVQGRNGSGIIAHKVNDKVGQVVGARMVTEEDQLMLVTDTGRVIRIAADSISIVKSRASMGVRLMRLDDNERIVDIARLEESDEEDEEVDGEGTTDAPEPGDEPAEDAPSSDEME